RPRCLPAGFRGRRLRTVRRRVGRARGMEVRRDHAGEDFPRRRRSVLHAHGPDAARRATLQAAARPRGAKDQGYRVVDGRLLTETRGLVGDVMHGTNQPDNAQIRAELRQIIADVIGGEPADIDDDAPLLDYVTSSLALLAGIRVVYERFGVLLPIRP